uniref:Uncharacterized protein n=2 Tax=Candidatus Bipolaricaulota TaxID=67810 RepID=H5SNI0_9BACT|nr:hypothetical protein HGMM_F52A12C36 [uncultured Acetothermia bacterium]BAL59400.1 hypothetical protein HGMM_OP4C036 [Candidatus Acetothermum autotrophicum]
MGKQELWEEVLERGWNPQRIQAFVRCYGPLVRACILYHLRCYGDLGALEAQLRALEGPTKRRADRRGTPGEWLDLAQEVWQDVWLKIFAEGSPYLKRYQCYIERQRREDKPVRSFRDYLKGLVWHVFLKKAEGRPSRRSLPWAQAPPGIEDPEAWLEAQASRLPKPPSLHVELDAYWDQLLRCLKPRAEQIEQDLIQISREPATVLCWACAVLKRQLEGGSLENLLAFVTFFCSQRGRQRPGPPIEELNPNNLSLEAVAGRYWRWEEDICRLFGKQIRKDRVISQIQELLKASPYRDLLGSEGERHGRI